MYILGIETSCDETSAAIVSDNREILSNLVLSQIKEHAEFGGVVPEIAARSHLENLNTLIRAAVKDAGLTFDDLDGVAATCGPGLIGGVMVGMMAGKAISAAKNLPFIAVNHLEGHALTPRLTDDIQFPYLLLLISGGHTQLLIAKNVNEYEQLGTTLDDAAGECFDKSAKLMGLPYPGGPNLQDTALKCTDQSAALERFKLPRPMKGRDNCDFSFSGLKTAVRNYIEKLPEGDLQMDDIAPLAYATQCAMADVIADRCDKAMTIFLDRHSNDTDVPTLVISGGVAANTAIRERLTEATAKRGMTLSAPPVNLCGDNAAMIAWAGVERLQRNISDPLDCKARPRWPLDPSLDLKASARHSTTS